jgi:hypothetical protein
VAGPLYSTIAGTKLTRIVLIILIVAFFGALEAGNLGPVDLIVSLLLGSGVKLGKESPLIIIAIVIAIIIAIIVTIVILLS